MLEALKDPTHPDHEDMRDWLDLDHGDEFQLPTFDKEEINNKLRVAFSPKNLKK